MGAEIVVRGGVSNSAAAIGACKGDLRFVLPFSAPVLDLPITSLLKLPGLTRIGLFRVILSLMQFQ